MSYELNIISVGQKKVTKFREGLSFLVKNEKEDGEMRYSKIWPFMCMTEGVWYTIGMVYKGFFNAIPLCKSDFDADIRSLPIPYWIESESVRESLTPFAINEIYKEEIKKVMRLLVDESPQKTIMFHSRYQCPDDEVIQGVMTLEDFWILHEAGKILFNVCYIIRK